MPNTSPRTYNTRFTYFFVFFLTLTVTSLTTHLLPHARPLTYVWFVAATILYFCCAYPHLKHIVLAAKEKLSK